MGSTDFTLCRVHKMGEWMNQLYLGTSSQLVASTWYSWPGIAIDIGVGGILKYTKCLNGTASSQDLRHGKTRNDEWSKAHSELSNSAFSPSVCFNVFPWWCRATSIGFQCAVNTADRSPAHGEKGKITQPRHLLGASEQVFPPTSIFKVGMTTQLMNLFRATGQDWGERGSRKFGQDNIFPLLFLFFSSRFPKTYSWSSNCIYTYFLHMCAIWHVCVRFE